MTVQMDFELPFAECEKCFSFDPIVKERHYEAEGFTMKMTRTLTCKGYNFCKYLKENVIGNRGEN